MIISDNNSSTQLGDICEWNPETNRLLKAVEKLSLDAVRTIVSNGAAVNGYGSAFHETPLHKAAQLGWTEGVELLLSSGANVYAKNQFDQTPLHYACASKSCSCVRLLIQAGCQASLHQQDKRGHTPLHDAAADGCDKCVSLLLEAGAQSTLCDFTGETPLHKAAKARSIPTMLNLLGNGADMGAKDKTGESVLSFVLRYIPGGMDVLFDNCLKTNTSKISMKKLEVMFNFLPISGFSEKNQVRTLRDIVELGHPKLLLHPLCEAYLLLKWHNVRRFFFIEVIFYFIYAILASYLILDKFIFQVYQGTPFPLPSQVFNGLEVVVLIQAVIILLKEGLVIVQGIRTWAYSLWHVLNCIISLLMIIVLIGDRTLWQHHLATAGILLLWVQCMLHISRFPSCGIYVAMFSKVAKVFLRIFLIFFCLLFAFSMSFFVSKYGRQYRDLMNAGNSSTEERTLKIDDKVYSDPGLTFFKTLTMMIGELDFDGDFVSQLGFIPGTSHVIYLSFVILVSIILSNLLVALAVNDVQGLRNSAYLERLIKQMELVFQIEKTFVTMDNIASALRLSRLTQRRKSFMHNLITSRVTLEPHHPQKSHKITLSDKGSKHEVDVKRGFVTSVLECLRAREELSGSNKKLSLKRAITRPSRTGTDDIQDGLKSLETTILEALSEKMDEINTSFRSLRNRVEYLETSLQQTSNNSHMAQPNGSRGVRATYSYEPTSGQQTGNERELQV